MEPINYSPDVASPFTSALQGVQLGAAMSDIQLKQQQAQMALRQQQQMQADLVALHDNPNPAPQDYAAMIAKYPQLSEHFKRAADISSGAQQQAKLNQATQVYAALQSGHPEVAQQLLTDHAAALRNSGNEADAKSAETMAKWIETDPGTAKTTTALMLSATLGPDKFATAFPALATAPATIQKANADAKKADTEAQIAASTAPATIQKANADAKKADTEAQIAASTAPAVIAKADLENKNLLSQINNRAGQLALDRDKLTSDVQLRLQELGLKQTTLGDDAKKIINDASVGAVASRQAATQMNGLADQFEKADPASFGGGIYEWLKNTTGSQNYVSSLRREYDRVVNKEVLGALPPGPASDRDIALAREGFLKSTADPGQVASFLRGMAKLQNYSAQLDDAKAEWVNSVGHLGRAKQDITIGTTAVPAGTTYSEFISRVLKPIGAQTQPPGRSYMRFAAPETAPAADSNRQGD